MSSDLAGRVKGPQRQMTNKNTSLKVVQFPLNMPEQVQSENTRQPRSEARDRQRSKARTENKLPEAKNKSQEIQGQTIQIISNGHIRNLRIPIKRPPAGFLILTPAETERIVSMSRVLTKEDKEAQKEAHRRKKEREIEAVEERKNRMIMADLSRKEKKTMTEQEREERDCAQHLVERASELRMEQEEELKQLNSMILGAQCQAARDEQVQEKKQIQAALCEEEKRLDNMMEMERRKALVKQRRINALRKHERISGKKHIHDQIQQHLEDKLIHDEMKEIEKVQIREEREKMHLEDLKALEKKREEQKSLQAEIRRINAETLLAKKQKKEEQKLADLRDMEFIQNKQKQEAEYEAEQKQIKKNKELEMTKMRAKQEKAKDCKAEQDELRALRHQGSARREWRKKEKEKAEEKAQKQAMLRAACLEQVQVREQLRSIQASQKKAELGRVLKAQQEATMQQKEEEEKTRQKALRHAEAMRRQVKERELAANIKRQETLKEAERVFEDARERRLRLDEIKEKMLRELKDMGISEQYCSDVERKARVRLC